MFTRSSLILNFSSSLQVTDSRSAIYCAGSTAANFRPYDLENAVPRQEVNLFDSHHRSMTAKVFEFIKCCDPKCGIGYDIIHNFLPKNLTTLFWLCFVPLRAVQWKDALTYFDPDLKRFVEDSERTSRPLVCEIFKQCDKLFAARHRDVVVRLLGALNRELDCIEVLQDLTTDMVKHVKEMVVSRLKILCPPPLQRQRLGSSTMMGSSAAILGLDDETAALLSGKDLMMFGAITQVWYQMHQHVMEEKLKASINDKPHHCASTSSPRPQLDSCSEAPQQKACYCCYVWETIKDDTSNLFQITAESLSSLLHAEMETVFPTMRKGDTEAKYEKLGDMLGKVFRLVGEEREEQYLPLRVTIFRRAMTFVPEFVFAWLPLLYNFANTSLNDDQRCRQAATYRHLVLLSLLVQACALVEEFLREDVLEDSSIPFMPFETWLFKCREAELLETSFEARKILQSIHRTVLEREIGMSLPRLYT